jgi:hypothetical protein
MVGEDAERFCESCRTRVFDLSTMSEKQARKLLAANVGKTLCVRYRADSGGNLLHRPPRPAPAAAGAVLSAALAGGCASHGGDGLLDTPSEGVCTDVDGTVMACVADEEWPPEAEEAAEDPEHDAKADVFAQTEPEQPEDDGYWFEEDPVVEEELDPTAPEEGCTKIEVDDQPLMGAVVVVDRDYRQERTDAYLRAHTERVRAWFADRKERRQARRAKRRLARIDE